MIIINGENLLNSPFQIIAHQVNCMGVMNAGVAKAIRNNYPDIYEGYQEFIDTENRRSALGKCYVYKGRDRRYVLNLFGQFGYGRFKVYTEYWAFEDAMIDGIKTIQNECFKEDGCQLTIAIPYGIGCGLAGGDWGVVTGILKKIEKKMNVVFVAYKLNN